MSPMTTLAAYVGDDGSLIVWDAFDRFSAIRRSDGSWVRPEGGFSIRALEEMSEIGEVGKVSALLKEARTSCRREPRLVTKDGRLL